jgi:hypothetical protein
MTRRPTCWAVIAFGLFSVRALADIYSPTQDELLSVEFADFFPGNGAALVAKAPVASDSVKYTFDTGLDPSPTFMAGRVAFETPTGAFLKDFTGLEAFRVLFEPNMSANPLTAQIFVRSGANEFTSSGAVAIPAGAQTPVSIPIGAIPTESDITSFGIEFFSGILSTEDDAMVTATTAPQPPDFVDTVLWSFEGPDGPGGAGSLEGWGPSFEPDHAHSVVETGATHGTHAMQVVRTYTGEPFPEGSSNISFRWGSDVTLDADDSPAPIGDYNDNGTVDAADYAVWRNALNTMTTLPNDQTPGTVDQADYDVWKANFGTAGDDLQTRIENIINGINNGDEIAFDVTFENTDNFPDPSPSFIAFHMFLQDGSAGFWQWDQLDFPIPAVGESATITASVPLSAFTDRTMNEFPPLSEGVLNPADGFFRMGIASNANAGITFQIDNIRIRTAIPPGLGGAVPEPSTGFIGLLSVIPVVVGRRRSA